MEQDFNFVDNAKTGKVTPYIYGEDEYALLLGRMEISMKRIFWVCAMLIMLGAVVVWLVFATGGDNVTSANAVTISAGQTINVELTHNATSRWFSFTPVVSGVHIFQSSSTLHNRNRYMENAFLYNASLVQLAYSAPDPGFTPGSNNTASWFRIAHNLTAGRTYFFRASGAIAPGVDTIHSYTFYITEPTAVSSGANVTSDNAHEVYAGQTINVELAGGATSRWFRFTPAVSGVHVFESSSTLHNRNRYMENAFLFNSSLMPLANSTPDPGFFPTDNPTASRFRIAHNLIEGNTYFFEATGSRHPEPGTIHSYTFSITEPTSPFSGANVTNTNAYEINAGQIIAVDLAGGATDRWFKFTPAVSGVHIFESSSTLHNRNRYMENAFLYNANFERLAYSTPAPGFYPTGIDSTASRFRIAHNLIRGNTYYFRATESLSPGTDTIHSYTFNITEPTALSSGANVNSTAAFVIEAGQTINVDLAGGATSRWYRFIPEVSGVHIFESSSTLHNRNRYMENAFLYIGGVQVAYSTPDPGFFPGNNPTAGQFRIAHSLRAGRLYFFRASGSRIPGTDTIHSYTFTITAPEDPRYNFTPNDWDDAWFFRTSSEYNHQLAIASAALSAGVYDRGWRDELRNTFGLDQFYPRWREAMFTGAVLVRDEYEFSSKVISNGTQEYLLFVVAIRGTPGFFSREMLSNILVGAPSGFTLHAEIIYADLLSYVREIQEVSGIEGRTKFLITGHSRGGALTNQVARMLLDQAPNDGNVFAYTFASPNTRQVISRNHTRYNAIFNIMNHFDPVANLLHLMTMYGTDLWINAFFSCGINHGSWDYLTWMRANDESNFTRRSRVRAGWAACPVDLRFYDGNEIIGEIINNEVVYQNDGKLLLLVVDDVKYFWFLGDSDYRIEFLGTDTGTMDVAIFILYADEDETQTGKEFIDVELYYGRQLVAEIPYDPSEVRLFAYNSDGERQEIEGEMMEFEPGVTPPPTVIPGNVTGSGTLSAADVGLLRAYLAGFPVEIVREAADVNGDGLITAADLGLIRAYLAGHPVTLLPAPSHRY